MLRVATPGGAGSQRLLDRLRSDWGALRMPTLPDKQAEILRKLDIEGLLGTDLMVVGDKRIFSLRMGRQCDLSGGQRRNARL